MGKMYVLLKRIMFVSCLFISVCGYAGQSVCKKADVSFSQFMDGKTEKVVYKSVSGKPLHLYTFCPDEFRKVISVRQSSLSTEEDGLVAR